MLCGFRGFFILLVCFDVRGGTNRGVNMMVFFVTCASID